MKSKQEDGIDLFNLVLHKTEFEKIIKNSPKTNQEDYINPPSYSQSFFLDNSQININGSNQQKGNFINEIVFENYNRWVDQLESTKAITYFSGKKKNGLKKRQEFQIALQIAYTVNYLFRFTKSIFFLSSAFILPSLVLCECHEILEIVCFCLSIYHMASLIMFNICIYLENRNNVKSHMKDAFLNNNTKINLIIVLFLCLQITYQSNLIISIISFYYFNTGFNIIQTFIHLLLITKKKYYNHLAFSKIITYYLFLIHLFTCILPEYEFSDTCYKKYRESLVVNISFFTFQQNQFFQLQFASSIVISQIAAFLMLLQTIDAIFQIRQDSNCIKNKIKFDVHMLQFYFWQHKGNLLKKLEIYSQFSNRELTKEQKFQQKLIQKIYYQILKDSLIHLKILTKEFLQQLSEKVKILRKPQDFKNNQKGLHIILQGNGFVSFIGSGLKQYESDLKDKVFGLIDCFQPNLSDLKLTMMDQFLIIFISTQDFQSCLKSDQDVETFHVIKNKIMFDGDTQLIGLKCLICNGHHIIKRCQVVKDIFDFLKDANTENQRQKQFFKRRPKRRPSALYVYSRKCKKSVSVTVDPSQESSDSSSDDEFVIYPDELSGSHQITEKNYIPVTSKNTITLQKDGQEDFVTEKYLLEQLRLSHRQISLQQPQSNPQTIDLMKPDFRSFPQCPSIYKFQDLLSIDDIDVVKEYAYFYPEFNISYIISMLQN